MYPVDGEFILKIGPKYSGEKKAAQAAVVNAISPVFAQTLDAYDINTKLRIAHFVAQVMHESAGFRATEEFASGDAFEGRADLGNTQKGDGRRYKGRGLLQLTGRANYRRMGETLGLPLEEQPQLASEPVTALKIACEYWKSRELNARADEDDLIGITRRYGGGLNGLEDRRNYLKRAKEALAGIDAIVTGASQDAVVPVLRRGSRDNAVGELQRLLRAKGHPIGADNEFGAATELAVKRFQQDAGLDVDGIVGETTWNALKD